jgi:formylglycine-generating enzyme required for sulfatase activity
VQGTWNGITGRDGEQIRRLRVLMRFLGERGYLQSSGWLPHSGTDHPALFASYWPLEKDGEVTSAAWTVVKRGPGQNATGAQTLHGTSPPAGVTWHYYDLWAGKELSPHSLALDVEHDGYGGLLATPNSTEADPELAGLLKTMSAFAAKPLASFDPTWFFELGAMVEPAAAPASSQPKDMVKIPGGKYRFVVSGSMIEGAGTSYNDIGRGVDTQFSWEPRPNRFHSQYLWLKPYWIDVSPVTQEDFATYLRKEGVQGLPADRYHYLMNWDWSGSLPKPQSGNEALPVTYIGYAEAQAYCRSLGKRLPSSVEWQYAGQGAENGTDGEALLFPWGQHDNITLRPAMTTGNIFRGPEPVDKYSPAGDSVFGLKSMVGNVWQMTSEYADGHTRSVILRGGSNYRPSGSGWYLPETLRGNRSLPTTFAEHEKYFLMDSRYERAGTVGFRCAADLPTAEAAHPCQAGGTSACGKFDAPAAFTTLGGKEVKDWMTFGRVARMAKGSGVLPHNVTALTPEVTPTFCPKMSNSAVLKTSAVTITPPPVVSAGVVSFSWTDGSTAGGVSAANISTGLCSPTGLRFVLPLTASQGRCVLTLWAGASSGTLAVNATIGGGAPFYSERLEAAPSDYTNQIMRSNRWDIHLPAQSAAADLVVDLTVSKPYQLWHTSGFRRHSPDID